MARLPDLRVADLNERQSEIYKIVARPAREYVQGPIRALLLSPTLAEKVQTFGAFAHEGGSFEPRLSELAILVVSRAWSCQYEWYIHAPHAAKAGISAEIIEAIRTRREPVFKRDDEATLYRFSTDLLRNHKVSTPVYDKAVELFGLPRTAELIGLLGYFVVLAMALNGFELELPAGTEPPLPD